MNAQPTNSKLLSLKRLFQLVGGKPTRNFKVKATPDTRSLVIRPSNRWHFSGFPREHAGNFARDTRQSVAHRSRLVVDSENSGNNIMSQPPTPGHCNASHKTQSKTPRHLASQTNPRTTTNACNVNTNLPPTGVRSTTRISTISRTQLSNFPQELTRS